MGWSVRPHVGRIFLRVQPLIPQVAQAQAAGAPRRDESAAARRAHDSLDGLLLAHLVRVSVGAPG
jgi:hypothetical protein